MNIAGKRGHNSPFLRLPPFLEVQDVPTFIGVSGKQKYWITLVIDLYIISTLKVS